MSSAAEPLFDRSGWWNPKCREFRSLRGVSEFRLELLQRWLPGSWQGKVVVDLGCGGGLLAIPLAHQGARVLGLDLAHKALLEAEAQHSEAFCAIRANMTAPPVASHSADLVLLADVLEHVDDRPEVMAAATRLVRPGGYLFVNTIHKTMRSRLLAITLGEGLGYIPRGTHQWRRFVPPSEVSELARQGGLSLVRRIGEAPRLWATLRTGAIVLRETSSLAVGYAALYRSRA
jgi:2-polyprenyl-6-hydroxyphenyl methylase / 3-demethylubiquinone-9 3-methyltransferase